MSLRQAREDRRSASNTKHLPVACKCLAIVLLPQKKHKSGAGGHSHDVNNKDGAVHSRNTIVTTSTKSVGGGTGTGPVSSSGPGVNPASAATPSGKDILDDFKAQNKTCYWNPALVESIRQLEYLGFVEPCTVLVSGQDIHLENLRSAWGRRVLKAPAHFTIDRIGDVNGIEMQVIPQTQFIPLPDSLCLIITELNKGSHPAAATLESIRTRLQRWYSHTNLPTHQLIYDTLGQLIRERKVFHDGNGYCVVTPDMYQMPTTADPTLAATASWLPYHPMYIPVFPPHQQQQPPYKAPTRSISCQVTQIEDPTPSEDIQPAPAAKEKKKSRARSHSVRACRGKDRSEKEAEKENAADFKRSSSSRLRTDKAKAMTKDLNLKTSNLNQDKDKGEKASLFSKIFGRKKKKSAAAAASAAASGSTAATATTVSTCSGGGGGGGKEGGGGGGGVKTSTSEAEFVTFSAQFPPPEWLWYQQQQERQKRTEEWVTQQLPKSATWGGHLSSLPPPSASSCAPPGGSLATAGGASSSLHPYSSSQQHHHHPSLLSHHHHHHQQHPSSVPAGVVAPGRVSQSHVYATLGRNEVVRGGGGGTEEEQRKMKLQHRMSGSHVRKSHHHHGHHHREKHRGGDPRKALQENNYDVPAGGTQHYALGAHRHVASAVDFNPYSVDEDAGIYCTPGPSGNGSGGVGGGVGGPWHSTPCYDVPPSHFDSAAMPSHIHCNNSTQPEQPSEAGRTSNPNPHQHNHHHHQQQQRRSAHHHHHRSKRHKQHKVYDVFDGGAAGNDITIEYKGRMPKKNSSVAQSRDSGVNCMGLPGNQNRQQQQQQQQRVYLEEEKEVHHTTTTSTTTTTTAQEASAYLPSRIEPSATLSNNNNNNATASSSMQADTMSTQRGTPYVSMDTRNPEGCSMQQPPIINHIHNPISGASDSRDSHHRGFNGGETSNHRDFNSVGGGGGGDSNGRDSNSGDSHHRNFNSGDSNHRNFNSGDSNHRHSNSGDSPQQNDYNPADRDSGGPSGSSGGGGGRGGGEWEGGEEERGRWRESCSAGPEGQPGVGEEGRGERRGYCGEMRSEGEGVSVNTSPQYMTMSAAQPQSHRHCAADDLDPNPDPNATPQYVAMSYCDSSVGEEGAGGGEVLLCQAEINQFQVPQLVLDSEARLEDVHNPSNEPDIALSSAGSKDTLDRPSADAESERSAETVVRSPQFAGYQSRNSSNDGGQFGDRDDVSSHGRLVADSSSSTKVSDRSGDDACQERYTDSYGDPSPQNGMAENGVSLNGSSPTSSSQNGLVPQYRSMSENGMSQNSMSPNSVSPNGMSPNGVCPSSMYEKAGMSMAGDCTMSSQGGGEGRADQCAVSALGSEFHELGVSDSQLRQMGVIDSGFSSPRNNINNNNINNGGNDNKENQQQQQQQPPAAPVLTGGAKKVNHNHHLHQQQQQQHPQQNPHNNHPHPHPHQPQNPEGTTEESSAPEHRSKHERIKAFVKQTNQLLEQRQFSGPVPFSGGVVVGGSGRVEEYKPEPDVYANYPPPPAPPQPSQVYPQQQQHQQHYAPFHLVPQQQQQAQQHSQQQQQQQPPPVILNNLRNHHQHQHHHNHNNPSRPHSIHDGLKERPRSQNVWLGQGQGQGHIVGNEEKMMSPKDLKAFQEQQHKGKKFGINGEFEVVGVV